MRLDWVRIVGGETAKNNLDELLTKEFGDPTSLSTGAKWFKAGTNWHPGITLSYGHRSEIIQLDVRGERLAILGTDAAISLMDRVYAMYGFRATRLDAAVDWVGQGVQLHQNAVRSCKEKQLCRLRRYADDSEYTAAGEPKRLLLKLGKRENPVCGRIYDKGLESGTASIGLWERLEIEFKEDRAQTLAMMLLSKPAQWPEILTDVVFGSIDFRINNGRSEITRRPRVAWWADLLAGSSPRPVERIAQESSFEQWMDWFRNAVGPRLLQFAEILQTAPAVLVNDLLTDLRPAQTETPAVLEVRALAAIRKPNGQL